MFHCQIQMELPSEAGTVPLCHRTAQVLLQDLAVDEARAAEIAVAVSEATGNVVRHAGARSDQPYCVTLTFFTDRVRLVVADQGCGFTPVAASEPDLEPLGGRGLWLIEQFADAVAISTLPGGGCTLEAEFFLPHPIPTPPEGDPVFFSELSFSLEAENYRAG
jgi:anti-sigma regulatory factor (Ser/Thr protein kinase)